VAPSVAPLKDPAKVRVGMLGARARWGEPRTVRIDDLTPDQRRLVLALIDAARQPAPPDGAQKRTPAPAKASAQEVRDASARPPTAG
jgi:hypothetical protein